MTEACAPAIATEWGRRGIQEATEEVIEEEQ